MAVNHSEYMNHLLEETMAMRGTDLHLCAGSKPLVRVNSKLQEIGGTEVMKPDAINAVIKEYLGEENMALLERNKFIDFSYSKRNLGRFRCNVYQQRGTYAMAIRALPLEIPSFDSLNLPEVIKKLVDLPSGLVLVTGATGSGKSTTLASIIDMINVKHKYHIVTIEDPIEYLHAHKNSMVTQREIGSDASDFASSLKAALRGDPDVIMVGEMRDIETISTALTAAETGHLVLSTLHTVSAVKSIDRIIDAFNKNQQNQVRSQLSSVLQAIVSQQLMPRKDGQGLCIATEVMLVNPAIRNLIREGKQYQISSLIQTGSKQGMVSMERELATLVRDGILDRQLALARSIDPVVFENYLKQMEGGRYE